MRPRYAFLARSLEDLASNPQIAPIVWKESSTHDDIKVKQVKEKVCPSYRVVYVAGISVANLSGDPATTRTESRFRASDY